MKTKRQNHQTRNQRKEFEAWQSEPKKVYKRGHQFLKDLTDTELNLWEQAPKESIEKSLNEQYHSMFDFWTYSIQWPVENFEIYLEVAIKYNK